MNNIASDVAKLIEILPEKDQLFALEFAKKLVLAWDPDFTKLTPNEKKELEIAKSTELIPESEIDWDKLN